MKKIVHLRMNEEMNDTVLYSRVDNIGKKRRECMGFFRVRIAPLTPLIPPSL